MSTFKCPFCGSDKLKIDRDTIELNKDGIYVPTQDFCCLAQKQNAKYRNSYVEDDKPDLEDISKY
jgi:hypothetical protein